MSMNAKHPSMDEMGYAIMCKQLAPPLNDDKHKGEAGRIGVFGGCLEYTGAPYFAAISALKVGADLVHVFCMKDAATVIKSYSPELIVHPYLDDSSPIKKIEPWLDRLHVILIGPGLGREPAIFNVISKVIDLCKTKEKPMVIDADGLFFVAQHPEILKNIPPPGVILTPNKMEYARLIGLKEVIPSRSSSIIRGSSQLFTIGPNVTILCKGAEDEIMDFRKSVKVSGGGSGRRCGGQGDLLAGSLSTFFCWALQHKVEEDVPHDDRAVIACFAACKLIRECNARAFKRKGRSMLASDMIEEIHPVFQEMFELR